MGGVDEASGPLFDIADKAIEVDLLDRRRLDDLAAYREAIRAWQQAHQKFERMPSDSEDWQEMRRATAGEFGVLMDSKRQLKNARSRLSNAIRKYRAAGGAA